MPQFNFSFIVNAPAKMVADFHYDTAALKTLTPPPMFVQLHDIEPMGNGSISEFTLWLGFLPLHWTAIHSDVTEFGFTDTQMAGPAERWVHTHRFLPIDKETTKVVEHIDFEHGRGFWGVVTRLLFAKPGLHVLFSYRKIRTRLALNRSK